MKSSEVLRELINKGMKVKVFSSDDPIIKTLPKEQQEKARQARPGKPGLWME